MQSDFFKNLKIVELASVLAGPVVGTFFAELGAEVLKIENQKTGGDMTRGYKPEIGRSEMPLTKIVARALDQISRAPSDESGEILSPYRDYRGVEVIGAWHWNSALKFGLITVP